MFAQTWSSGRINYETAPLVEYLEVNGVAITKKLLNIYWCYPLSTPDFLTNRVKYELINNFWKIQSSVYKWRWQVELFFKWIKQHLRIKAFYGTSENAVKTQIWIAIYVYVLVAIIRKRLHLVHNLYTLLQILSVSLFKKVPLDQLFANFDYKICTEFKAPLYNQLNLFDY